MGLLSFLPNPLKQEDLKCNSMLLQYYGLEGMSTAISYSSVEKVINENFCPSLTSTCCTSEDFDLTREMWSRNSKKVKRYLTQVFRIIQKISMIQSSLIQFMTKIQSKNTPTCKRIDSTFLNSPIKFDEVHFYIRNAFEAFAYMQKGFYCTICDPKKHKLFNARINYGRIFMEMSEQSCKDIIFFFREYLAYKVYFVDPLFKTINQLINCVKDTNEEYFDNSHVASYQAVSDCLANKNYCYKVCKEFRLGMSSNLFVGKLSEFQKLLSKMQEIMNELTTENDPVGELEVLNEEISNEFFLNTNDTIVMNNMNFLKDSNVSKAEVLFSNDGLDIFSVAVNSNYFLTDEMTLDQIQKNFNIGDGIGEDLNMLNPSVMRPTEEFTQDPNLENNRANKEEFDRENNYFRNPDDSTKEQLEKLQETPPGFSEKKDINELQSEFEQKFEDDYKMSEEEQKKFIKSNDTLLDNNWGVFDFARPKRNAKLIRISATLFVFLTLN